MLPGDAANVPEGIDVTQAVVLPALEAMQADQTGALTMAQIDQIPIPFETPEELVESILTALAYYAMEFTDLNNRTHGQGFFDNSDTQYTGALPPELLQVINAGVERFAASPSALNYLEHFYNPSGVLRIPMLTLATSRDAVVPGFPPDFIHRCGGSCRRIRISRSARDRAIRSPHVYSRGVSAGL